jgi:hypothetical protein
MIKRLLKFLGIYSNPKKEKQIVSWTKPDEKGVIYAQFDDGTQSEIGLQTFSQDKVRKLQLIADGYTSEEASNIIKAEKRNKAIDEILK